MPTQRPRYQVTETDEVARALDAAARVWPGEPRSTLLSRVIAAGGAAVTGSHDAIVESRRDAIRRANGTYTDAFPAGYLDEVREGWTA